MDYSVAKGGKRVAYRREGETKLPPRNLVWVRSSLERSGKVGEGHLSDSQYFGLFWSPNICVVGSGNYLCLGIRVHP